MLTPAVRFVIRLKLSLGVHPETYKVHPVLSVFIMIPKWYPMNSIDIISKEGKKIFAITPFNDFGTDDKVIGDGGGWFNSKDGKPFRFDNPADQSGYSDAMLILPVTSTGQMEVLFDVLFTPIPQDLKGRPVVSKGVIDANGNIDKSTKGCVGCIKVRTHCFCNNMYEIAEPDCGAICECMNCKHLNLCPFHSYLYTCLFTDKA